MSQSSPPPPTQSQLKKLTMSVFTRLWDRYYPQDAQIPDEDDARRRAVRAFLSVRFSFATVTVTNKHHPQTGTPPHPTPQTQLNPQHRFLQVHNLPPQTLHPHTLLFLPRFRRGSPR